MSVTTRLATKLAEKSVRDENGCLRWQGTLNEKGYGLVSVHGRTVSAHRTSYQVHVGPIPEGLEIDHLCRVRDCIEPTHLEAVTHRENLLRMMGFPKNSVRQNECVAGHLLAGDNVRITNQGLPACRICIREQRRRYKAQRVECPHCRAKVTKGNFARHMTKVHSLRGDR